MSKITNTLAAAGIGLAVLAVPVGLGWFGLVTSRPMSKYSEETRAQVYDTSRQFQQGTNRDVARYCEQMRGSETDAGRKSTAALIRSTLSTYSGPLSADNQDCANEAGAL